MDVLSGTGVIVIQFEIFVISHRVLSKIPSDIIAMPLGEIIAKLKEKKSGVFIRRKFLYVF